MIIGVWGDSISYGSCDPEALGWVGRLRKSLPTDDEHHIYNFGVCGDTSSDLLFRFKIEAEAIKPDYVIFAVGLNDTKYQSESDTNLVPQERYIENIHELLNQAHEYTKNIYIICLTKVDEAWSSTKGSRFLNEDILTYNQLLLNVAKNKGVPYINVFDVVHPDTDLADGLHPNAEGYQKLFEVIKNSIKII